MKGIALILCAVWALGVGVVAGAQGGTPASPAATAVGTAQAVDETTLSIVDQAAPAAPGPSPAGPNTLVYFLRMLVVLALVLSSIYGVFRLMRRLSRPRSAVDSPVRVLASASLGPGKGLHVVSLGSKAWLLGSTDSSVSLIAELDDRELLDSLELKAATAPAAGAADFASLLGSLLGAKGARKRGPGSAGGDFLARQRDRLRKL